MICPSAGWSNQRDLHFGRRIIQRNDQPELTAEKFIANPFDKTDSTEQEIWANGFQMAMYFA
jgi:hypothetical protein